MFRLCLFLDGFARFCLQKPGATTQPYPRKPVCQHTFHCQHSLFCPQLGKERRRWTCTSLVCISSVRRISVILSTCVVFLRGNHSMAWTWSIRVVYGPFPLQMLDHRHIDEIVHMLMYLQEALFLFERTGTRRSSCCWSSTAPRPCCEASAEILVLFSGS